MQVTCDVKGGGLKNGVALHSNRWIDPCRCANDGALVSPEDLNAGVWYSREERDLDLYLARTVNSTNFRIRSSLLETAS